MRPAALLRTKKVDLVKLAKALLVYAGSWSDETVLEVYRWIIATGTETGEQWRRRDPLSHARFPNFGNTVGHAQKYPPPGLGHALFGSGWRDEAARVISRAVLGSSQVLENWRREMAREVGRLQAATLPVLMCRGDRGHFISRSMWEALTRRPVALLNTRFNAVHENARQLRGVALVPGRDGWALALRYGCVEDRQPHQPARSEGSEWTAMAEMTLDLRDPGDPYKKIPVQRRSEPTAVFVERCSDYINSIIEKP